MYNYKIKTSFHVPTKLDIYDARHSFSVWLKIGSNPPDINRFRSNILFAARCRILISCQAQGYSHNRSKIHYFVCLGLWVLELTQLFLFWLILKSVGNKAECRLNCCASNRPRSLKI